MSSNLLSLLTQVPQSMGNSVSVCLKLVKMLHPLSACCSVFSPKGQYPATSLHPLAHRGEFSAGRRNTQRKHSSVKYFKLSKTLIFAPITLCSE